MPLEPDSQAFTSASVARSEAAMSAILLLRLLRRRLGAPCRMPELRQRRGRTQRGRRRRSLRLLVRADHDKAKAFDQKRADFRLDLIESVARRNDDAGDARIADARRGFQFHEYLAICGWSWVSNQTRTEENNYRQQFDIRM